ncbi:trimeric intracellular cation channel family protein, partial [Vibrio parahaemolyticus]
GTKIAMGMGLHPGICMVSALVTGVFGGLLRDLICRQTPLVLHEELYASVALIASGMYLALLEFNVPDVTATIITLVTGYMLRMAAVRFKWRLPSFHLETEGSIH